MAKKKFDLELRVTTSGSVLKWEVLLENTNASSRVENWANTEGYFYKKLDKYQIDDSELDVFVGCEGKKGGKTTCLVIIDDVEQTDKVVCQNTATNYAHKSYQV